jgi:tRNA C32,U32 (ribose-2'-O)-methylase TrmJ
LLVNWLLAQGTNLVHYGIDPTKIMSKVAKRGKKISEEETWLEQEQVEYRKRMEVLMEQLKAEQDEFVSHRLEQELRQLDGRIMWDRGETHSLDQLLQNVKDEKWKKRKRFSGNHQPPRWADSPAAPAQRENHGFFSSSPFDVYTRR